MLVVYVGYLLPPNATADGIFARNEGINIGVGSFTTINLIGTRSGGDIVFGTDAGSGVLDIDIRSRWVLNASGIHTTFKCRYQCC